MAGGNVFTTIRSEGALLPADFLLKLVEPKSTVEGLSPADYHLAGTEKPTEAASRAWNHLLGIWSAFQAASTDLKPGERATTLTREKWLLPLFQELGYGRLQTARAFEIEGKTYPVSHIWQQTAIHLVGRDIDLDRRTPGVAGAARTSPHGLLQEFLNRSEGHLWGFVSNGLRLRVLHDNRTFTRQAYIEFDLAAMMDGQVFADFVLLWLVCHQSRVEGERADQCWLERWLDAAKKGGTRALDDLRDGVQQAIEGLGRGFLKHPANAALKQKLAGGKLDKQDYYRQLLREVYRLIFLFVAEDRDLLLVPGASAAARERYSRFYSVTRLRTMAERRRGTLHDDLWRGLSLVFQKVSSTTGSAELGLPALGSFLWSEKGTPDLDSCAIANADVLGAVRALAFTTERGIRRAVDYRNLGPEELGSVYESLLELHPDLNADAGTFALKTAAGHERKATGSYYTPTTLIDCLLDTALDPVLEEAAKKADPAAAILKLKVCDPACGSGHFLIAAAHRIANRLASVRTGEEEPSPAAVRNALRDVIGQCIYGVDANPMAVELCQVNLWLEALEPGKPLSFLAHHIQCGDSLLGATPALLAAGIPDEAFDPIEGDDKAFCKELKKLNKLEREGFRRLPFEHPWDRLGDLATGLAELDAVGDDTPDGLREKERRWEEHLQSAKYDFTRLWADAWCAAFVWRKTRDQVPAPITEEVFRTIERNPNAVPNPVREHVRHVAHEYQFFHWHLSFPGVFSVSAIQAQGNDSTDWTGGFDVVLGNPPWERVKLLEAEWFAGRRPDIAMAPNAATRKRLISALANQDRDLYAAFRDAIRWSESESAFLRRSGRYPLCGRGDINSYAVFAETFYRIAGHLSSCGIVVPSGILTDDTTKLFLKEIQRSHALDTAIDFENNESLFPGVGHGRMRFTLLTLRKGRHKASARFFFLARAVAELVDHERWFELDAEDAALINPNSETCPVFLTRQDAEITKNAYHRLPVLRLETKNESSWGARIHRVFDMTLDASVFSTAETLIADGWTRRGRTFHRHAKTMVPVIEGKMVTFYDHRAAHIRLNPHAPTRQQQTEDSTNSEKELPTFFPEAYLWAPAEEARERFRSDVGADHAIAFKRVTSATNWRTMVACVVPDTLAVSYTLYLLGVDEAARTKQHCLLAILNSFAYDYFVRQKTMQPSLPIGPVYETVVPTPASFDKSVPWWREQPLHKWVAPRIAELICVSNDLESFGPATIGQSMLFRWDPERRRLIQSELDAMAMHHFGFTRTDAERILATFPKVREYEQTAYGEYRSRRLILELYDRMHASGDAGLAYRTILDPPPGDPRIAHPPSATPRVTVV